MRVTQIFGALTLLAVTAGCSSMTPIQSSRSTGSITIDGNDADWRGQTKYFKDEKISVGVKHDDQNLYLCIGTRDRKTAKQLMRLGLTVWFDVEGGKSETFGIHYPLAMQGGMMMPMMGQRPESGMQGQNSGNPQQPSGNMQKPPDQTSSDKMAEEVEVVGENKSDTERMRLKQLTGVSLSLGKSGGSFVYEMKIPFQKDTEHPYAIGYDGKTPIGIGIKTGEQPDEDDRGEMGSPPSGMGGGGMGAPPSGGMGEPPSGGMGGPPGGGNGPRMGGGPGRQSSQSDDDTTEIDLWLKAELK